MDPGFLRLLFRLRYQFPPNWTQLLRVFSSRPYTYLAIAEKTYRKMGLLCIYIELRGPENGTGNIVVTLFQEWGNWQFFRIPFGGSKAV
jgi:hypothetical protein